SPFGSDFDDFILNIHADHLVQRNSQGAYAKIGFRKQTAVTVDYSRGTTDCSHSFKFLLRRCPNKNSTIVKTYTMNLGSDSAGAMTSDMPEPNSFLDIEKTASFSTTERFGGCPLPFPSVNLLYGGGVPVLVQ